MLSRDYKVGIYKITNKIDAKFYIGSSINITNRWKSHIKLLNNNMHHSRYFQNAWNKYGKDNFIFERIENVKDKSKLLDREQYYLDTLTPFSNLDRGYNINPTAGSNLGVKYSEASKKKMSEWVRTPEMKKKMSDARVGIKLSKETKEKLRTINTGKIHSDATKEKMSLSHKDKKLSEEHKTNLRKHKSKEHCKNISKGKKGIKFTKEHCKNISKGHSIPILKYNLNNQLIGEFDTSLKAAYSVNMKSNKWIIDTCKGRRDSAFGFIWKYK
jgi:group I intron endonuclease